MKKKLNTLAITVIAMTALVCIAIGAIFLNLTHYEEGLLDVFANQQDGYVQLVLDQINIKSNRDDAEIISEILGTLDSSSNKYWTFSKDTDMLFVKDVTESNKYRGLTTASFYRSDSAKEFLTSLKENVVTHSTIKLDDKSYIASGVSFTYNGNSYKICLLTNRDVLMDNNKFLGAKVELLTIMILVLLVVIVLPSVYAIKLTEARNRSVELENNLTECNRVIEELNETIRDKKVYNTKLNLWGQDNINLFLRKLKERGVNKVAIIVIRCASEEERQKILSKCMIMIDGRVVRFEYNNTDIMLMGANMDCEAFNEEIKSMMISSSQLAVFTTLKDGINYTEEDIRRMILTR